MTGVGAITGTPRPPCMMQGRWRSSRHDPLRPDFSDSEYSGDGGRLKEEVASQRFLRPGGRSAPRRAREIGEEVAPKFHQSHLARSDQLCGCFVWQSRPSFCFASPNFASCASLLVYKKLVCRRIRGTEPEECNI